MTSLAFRNFNVHSRLDKIKLYRLLFDAAEEDTNGKLRRRWPKLRRLNGSRPIKIVMERYSVTETEATQILKTLLQLEWIDMVRGLDDIRLRMDPGTLERPQLVQKEEEKPEPAGPSLLRAYKYLATHGKTLAGQVLVGTPARRLMGKFQLVQGSADELLQQLGNAGCIQCSADGTMAKLLRSPAEIQPIVETSTEPPVQDAGHIGTAEVEEATPALKENPRRGVGRRPQILIDLAKQLLSTRLSELYTILWENRAPDGTVQNGHAWLYEDAPENCLTREESVRAIGLMATTSRKWLSIPMGMDGDVIPLLSPEEIKAQAEKPIEITTQKRVTLLARKVYAALESYVSKTTLAKTGKRLVYTPVGYVVNALEMHGERKKQLDAPFAELVELGCIVWHERTIERRNGRPTTERIVELLHAPDEAALPTPVTKTARPKKAPVTPNEEDSQLKQDILDLKREFENRATALRNEFETKAAQLLARVRTRSPR